MTWLIVLSIPLMALAVGTTIYAAIWLAVTPIDTYRNLRRHLNDRRA